MNRGRQAIDTRAPNDPDRLREETEKEIEKAVISAVIHTAREIALGVERHRQTKEGLGRARSIEARQQIVRQRWQLVAVLLTKLPPSMRALPTHNAKLIEFVRRGLRERGCRVPSERSVASDIKACRQRVRGRFLKSV